jgi:hypothetical protein
MQQVVIGGERPKMDSYHTHCWPANLQWLMKACWSADPSARPTFEMIVRTLVNVLRGDPSIPEIITSNHDTVNPADSPVSSSSFHKTPDKSLERAPSPPTNESGPVGGFTGLFLRPIKGRSRSTGQPTVTPPKSGFKDMTRAQSGDSANSKGRSWGRR